MNDIAELSTAGPEDLNGQDAHQKLRVLVLGSSGFWGRNVTSTMLSAGHDVFGASRPGDNHPGGYAVDLTAPDSIAKLLTEVNPEVIINCAGIIDPTQDTSLNPTMTSNLLEQIASSGLKPKSIIIAGSASEYGIVDRLPVNEDAPLNATAGYGLSKLQEETTALELADKYSLPVVIARIFNPIGPGMGPRMLTSRILNQIQEIRDGTRKSIEINRMDAKRDLFDVVDAALAVKAIAEHRAKSRVYCIGSGKITTTGELIKLMLENSELPEMPEIIQTSDQPEPLVAGQADITRLREEFGWEPTRSIDDTVKEIMHAQK